MVKKIQFCNATDVYDNQGIIQSPNFPTHTENLDCSIELKFPDPRLISIYALDVNLETNFLGGR